MKLLVTGGAGYIGSVVTAQLLTAGHQVVVLDDLSTGHRDCVPDGAEFVEGRVHDAAQVLDPTFGGILHFAAKSLVAESVQRPELYWQNNLAGSLALVDAARAAGVARFVFSSTAAVYGVPSRSPIVEDDPTRPINPYGQSKLAVDMMLQGEAAAHGLSAVSLRYFNVGGAHGPYGERHDPESHLIPNVLRVAAGQGSSVSVFGTNYLTFDGTCIRDYLHVLDLAQAHLLALESASKPGHRVYNLGSGSGFSVLEVIEACRRVTGHALPIVDHPRRAGDPPELVASSSRIASELGWRPERDLDQIVCDAWAFAQSQVNSPVSSLGSSRAGI